MIDLNSTKNAFAGGGNRLCFIDPRDNGHCIKIAREDRTPELRRRQQAGLSRLKPLKNFDENAQEIETYQKIDRHIGPNAYALIPKCYGRVNTDLGSGICLELICDDDKQISVSLKQYLWENGRTEQLETIIENFSSKWVALGMPSRNLLLHNIVVQQKNGEPNRLVVIDGLGWSGIAKIAYLVPGFSQKQAKRKISRLSPSIDALLKTQSNQGDWGFHGWIEKEKRKI